MEVQSPASGWSDFGQKVDLSARLRECVGRELTMHACAHATSSLSAPAAPPPPRILLNYPEGTSILKELVQNADDARATRIACVLDRREHPAGSLLGEDLAPFQGPALLCFNDSVFSEQDYESISKIGDSVKRAQVRQHVVPCAWEVRSLELSGTLPRTLLIQDSLKDSLSLPFLPPPPHLHRLSLLLRLARQGGSASGLTASITLQTCPASSLGRTWWCLIRTARISPISPAPTRARGLTMWISGSWRSASSGTSLRPTREHSGAPHSRGPGDRRTSPALCSASLSVPQRWQSAATSASRCTRLRKPGSFSRGCVKRRAR
jgi:hypothetical protein